MVHPLIGSPSESLTDVLVPAAVVAGAVLLAIALAVVVEAVARRLGRRFALVADLTRRCHRPLRAVLVVAFGWAALAASTRPGSWQDPVHHVLLIVLIAAVAWLLVAVVYVLEDTVLRRYAADGAEGTLGRRVRTQARVLRRIGVAAVIVWAIGAELLTFPAVRVVGASLFASAGLLSVVAGIAAQSTFGNVFAGMQLAFTDAIRIGDLVVVASRPGAGAESGTVEEITLTYVVVRLWDERRVILPSTYFTTTPYENWTHGATQLLGTVELDLDWAVPVDAMRAELDRVLAGVEQWDGRVGRLQVTDAIGGSLRVRALVSARDAATLFDLRCRVREGLVAWLVSERPESLPHMRTQQVTPGGAAAAARHDEPGGERS